MPEGPEIRRAADRIERALGGRVVQVELHVPELRARLGELDGRRVLGVDTHGKAMLTRFEDGAVLYSHNQLYGRWYVERRGKTPRTSRSLRVALHGTDHSAYLFSATDVSVWRDDELDAHPFLAKLGPDLLRVSEDEVAARLADARFQGRSLAAVYLDQGFLAGLGNYLRAEILFVAGVHPAHRARELSESRRRLLAEATCAIARRSYASGGITLDERREAALRDDGVPRRGRRHYVYGREERPCRVCEEPIARIELGGRHVFVCPRCQG
jgi:endonuclease VIII